MMFKNKFAKTVGMTVLAASLAVSGSAMVFAQDAEVTPEAEVQQNGFRQNLQDRFQNRDSAVRDYIEGLGITRDVLQEAAANGSTLADVITANGGSVEEVTALMTTEFTERVQSALDAGRITQEEADERLSELGERIGERLSEVINERGGDRGQRGGQRGEMLEAFAEAVGLEQEAIMEQLQSGSSFTDIITAQGLDVDTVSASLVASMTERINQAVADGTLTQEQADRMINGVSLSDRVTDALNGERPNFGERGNRGGQRDGNGNAPDAPADNTNNS